MENTDSWHVFTRSRNCKHCVFMKEVAKSILSDCMDVLYILRNMNSQNTMIAFKDEAVKYISIEDRYTGTEDHAEFRINSVTSNYDKLSKNINMIMNVIKEGYDEIKYDGTCDTFETNSNTLKRMHQDEEDLLEDKEKNEKSIEDLKNKCEEERLLNISTIEETNAKIQKLRFEVEDALIYRSHEGDYFDKWEYARREQNQIACEDKENFYRNTIKEMQNKIDLENRCHKELETFMEENKNDCLDGIQYWMKHYDDEMELREYDMQRVRNDLEKTTDEFEVLDAKYKAQVEEMNNWLEYKRIQKEKDDQRKLELWAAIKIQAWWRGEMYRQKLGPYRKKKKEKGKKKGAKKK